MQHGRVFLGQRQLDRQLGRAVGVQRMEAGAVHIAGRGVHRRRLLSGESGFFQHDDPLVTFGRKLRIDAAGRLVDGIADRKRVRRFLGQRRFAGDAELTAAQECAGDRALIDRKEPASELRCGGCGRAAAGEQIEHQIAGLGGRRNDALQKRFGLLCQKAGPFAVLLLQMFDVRPDVGGVDQGIFIIGIGLAVRADREADASVLVNEALHVVAALRTAGGAHRLDVEQHLFALAVKQDRIVLSRIAARGAPAGAVRPDDLVHEVRFAEDLIKQHPRLVRHAVVEMQIDRSARVEQLVTALEDPAEPFDVVRFIELVLVKNDGLRLLALADLHLERFTRAKRRIEIDQPHAALIALDQRFERVLRLCQPKRSVAARRMQLLRTINAHTSLPQTL